MMNSEGFQVAPAELEGLLLGHSDILDACVIGVEDRDNATELPLAFIVLKPGLPRDETKEKEIIDWLSKQTAPYKKLRGGVRFVDEIPKSPAGKLLRRVLRDQVQQEQRKGGAKL